jgi:radical SAM superfamily enzyme YgiQ (UPF0313 family)
VTASKNLIILYFPSPFPAYRPWSGVPLSLLAISRQLDQQGYTIKIFARHLQTNTLKSLLSSSSGAVCLGISVMTGYQILDGLKIARAFKKAFPHIPIVWGGWHPSILPLETIKNKYVDIIVKGQGDETFTRLVHRLQNKQSLKSLNGIVYKSHRQIVNNPDSQPVNLATLPPIPYHLIDLSRCIGNTEYGLRTIPYISSYGCPHRCGFCVEPIVNKNRWVATPATQVVQEWQNLVKNYQADSIAVIDSNFFVDESRVRSICQAIINRKLNIKWGNANGRVRQMSQFKKSTWSLMHRSGCSMILTGAESGSQAALDLVTKDINVDDIKKFTHLCKTYNIKILYSFLVGLPWSKDAGENNRFVQSEYRSTLSLISQLLKICRRNRYTYYLFLPYPGAPLFDRAVKLGLDYPHSLRGWSQYLMSPEDAFNTSVHQRWISSHDARLTAMLTQYIFGLMDQDTYPTLLSRITNPFLRPLFSLSFYIALSLVRIRWYFKYFGLPIDYYFFTLVHKHGGLI